MKVLVTGGRGTLGKPLIKQLRENGHEVHSIDLAHCSDENYTRCDISEYRQIEWAIEAIRPDLIYILSAEFGRRNGEEYYEQVWKTNVIGTRHILELQKAYGFRVIFASSSEIYGEMDETVLSEDLSPAPQKNDYAISKWVNELQCRNFRERYGNEIMVLRFFNAYGPGEIYNDYRSVVCLFCYRALHNIPYEVYENYHRVFMYIDDFIPTLASTCDKFVDGEVVNIGGIEYRSVRELSDIILTSLGKDDSLVKYLPTDQHNVVNKRPDISKAEALFGHNPTTPLEVGVVKTLKWMIDYYKLNSKVESEVVQPTEM